VAKANAAVTLKLKKKASVAKVNAAAINNQKWPVSLVIF
jgi:hypothetical protein